MGVKRFSYLRGLSVILATLLMTKSSMAHETVVEIEYAYPDISVWTTQRDQDGKIKNPLVKLAAPLFKAAGIPWHPQDYPAKRMFANLRSGVSEFSMLVNAESLLQGCCLISELPVAVVEIRVFHRKSSPPVENIEALNGKSVITIQGYSYAGFRKYIQTKENQIRNNSAPDHDAAFGMLERGRAEYVVDYAFPAAEVLARNPIADITYSTLKRTNVYMMLHKSYPDAEATMAKLERIMANLDKTPFLRSPSLPATNR